MTTFRWVEDPEFRGETPLCPDCGHTTEALRVEPDRSESYVTHIFLCTGPAHHAFPYLGARAMRKRST